MDKVTSARIQHAQKSLELLESTKVSELRLIAGEIGVKQIERDGKILSINLGRKSELTQLIYSACEAYRHGEVNPPQTTLTQSEKESTYVHSYEELDYLARHFYYGDFDKTTNQWMFMGLYECARKIEIEKNPAILEFFALVSTMRPTLEKYVISNSKTGVITPSTLTDARSDVLKRIEDLVKKDPSIPEMGKLFHLFYGAVMASFKDISRAKTVASNQNLNKRQSKVIHVQAAPLLLWAKDVVINLPENSSEWRSVAIALMLLTGRRQSEIMSTAQFQKTDSPSHLLFSGQLKKHSGEVYNAFEIPILGNASEGVINGIEWLTRYDKRNLPTGNSDAELSEAAKKAHNRSSKPLSETVKKICEKYLGNSSALIDESESGKMHDRRTCHMMRQIYGQLVVPIFYPAMGGVSRKKNQILTEIMGHATSESSLKYTANAYDSDIEIADIESIKTFS